MDRTELFNKLESLRHKTPGVQTSMFDQTTNKPNVEYWRASELQQLCGITNMPWHKQNTDDMFTGMLYQFRHNVTQNINDSTILAYQHIIPETKQNNKKTQDMQLSRYAAWVLTLNNRELPFMHAYFMMPGADIKTIASAANDLTRLTYSAPLAQMTKNIAGILYREKINFSRFYADLHTTFFGVSSVDDLKNRHGIKIANNDSIHNYMDAISMAELAQGLYNIIHAYSNNPRHNADILSGITVRKMRIARERVIARTNHTPAQDIKNVSIKDVRAKLNKLELAFTKQYQPQILRS